LEIRPATRGPVFFDRSLYEAWAEAAKRKSELLSNGRPACRSTVAPSEPSSCAASAVLATLIELKRSEAKTLKSNERLRLAPPELSAPPVLARASMPLMRTRVKVAPRPRTAICRPSPPSRARATPGMRWIDSDRFRSGNLPMSSARMASTATALSRLVFKRLDEAVAEAGDDDFDLDLGLVRLCVADSWAPPLWARAGARKADHGAERAGRQQGMTVRSPKRALTIAHDEFLPGAEPLPLRNFDKPLHSGGPHAGVVLTDRQACSGAFVWVSLGRWILTSRRRRTHLWRRPALSFPPFGLRRYFVM
jgi:hypothetical protein